MDVIKRNGQIVPYQREKITRVINLAFSGIGSSISASDNENITNDIEARLLKLGNDNTRLPVETIQDCVEITLMERGYYDAMKSYILYRTEQTHLRSAREQVMKFFGQYAELDTELKEIQKEFTEEGYSLTHLARKLATFYKDGMKHTETLALMKKASAELTTQDAPQWEMIAARFELMRLKTITDEFAQENAITDFYSKVDFLTREGLYGSYILEHYTRKEILEFASFMQPQRDKLFNISGIELLAGRYLIRSHTGIVLETPQEMFLGIAMHLAMKEEHNRSEWVHSFYNMLSSLKVTMATPTLANARRPFHQLSSCFIDTVPDDLDGIYRSISNFATVSKFGGGMGLYFGKVRARGSSIRGYQGAAGGVIRWVRLANDTAVAVDQLGVRTGAVAVYLDAWHKDLPEFLALRTNNGDDRLKAHDVFPAICYPDYFWEQARDNINGDWYLMCPHEIKTVKGYCLEDYYGDEWKERYLSCVSDSRISKRKIPVKDLVRLILKSAVETGTPFTFNRDAVNRANPNKHKGIIYCSNLCTEIAQNMSGISSMEQRVETVDGETVVVTTTKAGDFVVCNLASLNLGRIDVNDQQQLAEITTSAIRALDNVIDLNFFPIPYAQITSNTYRPLGLGVSGYHHMLAKNNIQWETQEHLDFVDKVFENINYAAISASCENAREKGAYSCFHGSEWESGEYFESRGYVSPRWQELREKVSKHGMRNGYLIAVAPTGSTSIIAGTTAGLDPVMKKFFLEEKKNGLMPRVAPDLDLRTFWLYKNAHHIDQAWSVRAAGKRSRHIDQAQSMNLYITNEYTLKQILNLYILAWEQGVKTIYYIRSKSLEIEECESCAS